MSQYWQFWLSNDQLTFIIALNLKLNFFSQILVESMFPNLLIVSIKYSVVKNVAYFAVWRCKIRSLDFFMRKKLACLCGSGVNFPNIVQAAFLYLQFVFVIFWQKESYEKAAHKTSEKSNTWCYPGTQVGNHWSRPFC